MIIDEKYVKLNPEGVVKRVDETMQILQRSSLHTKGLYQSISILKKILAEDIPLLSSSVTSRLSWSRLSTISTIFLGLLMALLVFLPDPTKFNINAEIVAKASFINATMSIVVGLFVLNFSISAWLKQKVQTDIRDITDRLHELLHRIDMYQMGKNRSQIIEPADLDQQEYDIQIHTYLNSMCTAADCVQKAAVIIYHQTDDNNITSGARHLEKVAGAMVEKIRTRWNLHDYDTDTKKPYRQQQERNKDSKFHV